MILGVSSKLAKFMDDTKDNESKSDYKALQKNPFKLFGEYSTK